MELEMEKSDGLQYKIQQENKNILTVMVTMRTGYSYAEVKKLGFPPCKVLYINAQIKFRDMYYIYVW